MSKIERLIIWIPLVLLLLGAADRYTSSEASTTIVGSQLSVAGSIVNLTTSLNAKRVFCRTDAAANLVRVGTSEDPPSASAGFALSANTNFTVTYPSALIQFIGDAAGPVTVYCLVERPFGA